MLSNDQPLTGAGFDAAGAVALVSPSDDPLTLDPVESPSRTFDQYVGEAAPRPRIDEVLNWTDQLLDAVHLLHTQPRPVIHGDIAPSTVSVVGGKATLSPSGGGSSADTNVNYKPLEQIWDNLDHVSKRVILNQFDDKAQNSVHQPLSAASDIYSVGATVYALVTGKVPADALDRTIAAMEGKPDPLLHPSEVSPGVPAEVGDVIMRAMSLQREDRPFSAVILRQIFRTASVRVQERLASEPAVAETVLEIDVPAATAAPVAQPEPQKDADEEAARQLALKILAEKSAAKEEPVPVEIQEETDEEPAVLEAIVVEEVPVEAAVVADEHISVDPTPVEPVETAPEPVTSYVPETSSFLDSDVQAEKSSSKGMLIGAVAAVLAVVAGIGYFALSSGSSTQKTAVPQQVEQPAAAPVSDPAPAQTADSQPAASQPPSETSPAGETVSSEPQGQNARTAAQPDKTKKAAAPTPAPAKPAPAKKQVTVDDLINDH